VKHPEALHNAKRPDRVIGGADAGEQVSGLRVVSVVSVAAIAAVSVPTLLPRDDPELS
jgi:hypothetical protein